MNKDKGALLRAKSPFISRRILTLREAIIYLTNIVIIGLARNYQILDPIKRCILEGKKCVLMMFDVFFHIYLYTKIRLFMKTLSTTRVDLCKN